MNNQEGIWRFTIGREEERQNTYICMKVTVIVSAAPNIFMALFF